MYHSRKQLYVFSADSWDEASEYVARLAPNLGNTTEVTTIKWPTVAGIARLKAKLAPLKIDCMQMRGPQRKPPPTPHSPSDVISQASEMDPFELELESYKKKV